MKNYDWNEIAFKNKSELKDKKYIFLAGSREISAKRLIQILGEYLPKGNLIIGILKEEFIAGFEGQPQFKTMQPKLITTTLQKIISSKPAIENRIDTIEYSQNELAHIINKIEPSRAVFINGSWGRMFHLRPEFFILAKKRIKYELISPFISEELAIDYLNSITEEVNSQLKYSKSKKYSDIEIFEILAQKARTSFATDFQTSCAIVKDGRILIIAHNQIVPYETYAMHFGSVKESNFSPPNDLNHYDTNHAEMMMLINGHNLKLDFKETKLYINLMPCPTCARILSQTGISEVIYSQDHSDGFAIKLLSKCGKTIRRFIE